MKLFAPSYYRQFSCIAGACRHSCCIGWEIDIDEAAYTRYRELPGAFGDRLRAGIADDGPSPHFVLQGTEERCPFLNARGLCEIILNLGEDALCQICTDHPRWRNFYADRTEIGLGLCCEAAAALILGWEAPVQLQCLIDDGLPDTRTAEELAFFRLRDAVLSALQNREKPLEARIADMLALAGATRCAGTMSDWASFLSSLEIMDEAWSGLLAGMTEASVPLPGHTGEQLLVYLVLRHLSKMTDGEDPRVLLSFAVLGYDLVCALYASVGERNFETLCTLVRLFSAEIEYSEENLCAILDEIATSCPIALTL